MRNEKYLPAALGSVELTDEYCKNALEKELSYLLSLDEGRLLAGFYENAGIRSPFVRYGGWESGLIGGHTMGHYLSALAQACANAGAVHERNRLLSRVRHIVDELGKCQRPNGFLWGAPRTAGGPEGQFDAVERGETDIVREAWVPWYTLHKILAGLLDVWRHIRYGAALEIAKKLGDWADARSASWDEPLRRKVLSVEYGGMNDCLYDLYAFTGEEKYAVAAHRFDEEELFDRILTEGKDVLKDVHANTTIPKIVGALKRYLVLHGEELGGTRVDASRYLHVAEAFFRIVTERHTYVTGGNSELELFGEDYVLDAERTACNCETCNVYNMLKLARGLFAVTGRSVYADYYDNAFTNSILSSQDPETGMTTYFQPMASGYFKVFSTPTENFWCCTGSGIESFTKLNDGIVYEGEDVLCLERYLSCRVACGANRFEVRCDFPMSDRAVIRVTEGDFTLALRLPDWADQEAEVVQNGVRIPLTSYRGHTLVRMKKGDVVEMRIPVAVTLKGLPDGGALAFRYGNAVLSADLGTGDMRTARTGVDVTVPQSCEGSDRIRFGDLGKVLAEPASCLVREGDTFLLRGADRSLRLGLHYKRYRERYAIYLHLEE